MRKFATLTPDELIMSEPVMPKLKCGAQKYGMVPVWSAFQVKAAVEPPTAVLKIVPWFGSERETPFSTLCPAPTQIHVTWSPRLSV